VTSSATVLELTPVSA